MNREFIRPFFNQPFEWKNTTEATEVFKKLLANKNRKLYLTEESFIVSTFYQLTYLYLINENRELLKSGEYFNGSFQSNFTGSELRNQQA